jgi:hypothetical protein
MTNPTFKPVQLVLKPSGDNRAVGTAVDAALALLELWPYEKQKEESYELACQACIKALEDDGPSEAAREAFIKAARSAGITVRRKAPAVTPSLSQED